MSFALLFSGQGAQHPAMLPWLADDGPGGQLETIALCQHGDFSFPAGVIFLVGDPGSGTRA